MLPRQAEKGRHQGLASGWSAAVWLYRSWKMTYFLGLVSELGLRGELLAGEAA